MYFISALFYVVAILSTLGAAGFAMRDAVVWLQTGQWSPVTNFEALTYSGIQYQGTTWIGLDHLIRAFLLYPFSTGLLSLCICGAALGTIIASVGLAAEQK